MENMPLFLPHRCFSRYSDEITASVPVKSTLWPIVPLLPACFQVVEKVKKRELSYKKRWGKCAESEAVDFKIVL
jgi:hypothetical protein